ncbi:hypothetical protein ACIGO8_16615 [Streptomyces sp. NPDC053493]|uniref:hypothetical protein n=1 Tax=Streptomyces sp. NPDC053493 TaxID=3365705 RepID=UPI0037D37AD7
MKLVHKALTAMTVVLLLAGCGTAAGGHTGSGGNTGSGEKEKPKMNMQQAAERADQILDETMAAIVPPVQWTHRQTMPGNCSTDRARTVMTIISEQRRSAFLGLVDRHWRSKGYAFRATSVDKLSAHYLTPDGFQLEVLIGWKGQAHFEITTPCVDKSEVLPPTTPPNGPDYSNQPPTAPNVTSDFWSSTTPLPSSSASS